MLAERHFKNEDGIKAKIAEGHRRGVCDSDGKSVPVFDINGKKAYIAKPRNMSSSVTKRYRGQVNGKAVWE